jgi:hypothetical protein
MIFVQWYCEVILIHMRVGSNPSTTPSCMCQCINASNAAEPDYMWIKHPAVSTILIHDSLLRVHFDLRCSVLFAYRSFPLSPVILRTLVKEYRDILIGVIFSAKSFASRCTWLGNFSRECLHNIRAPRCTPQRDLSFLVFSVFVLSSLFKSFSTIFWLLTDHRRCYPSIH